VPGNRRTSLVGAFLLIALGLLFLYSNVRPGLDPWPLLSRYWPVLLVFLGLGKLWDQFGPQDSARRAWLSGREIAVILLLVIFGIALSFSTASRQVHDVETVDRQGSEPVRIHIQMPAGEMKLSGEPASCWKPTSNMRRVKVSRRFPTKYLLLEASWSLPRRGESSTLAIPRTTGTFAWVTTYPWNSASIWAPAGVR